MKSFLSFLIATVFLVSCTTNNSNQQVSDSGIKKATTKVKTDQNGRTIEQENIVERLKRDNDVGSVKHLYVISSYTGDVLEYSTVKGKVTSGGKRLSPKSVSSGDGQYSVGSENLVTIGNTRYGTTEVLDDGGAYGESANYIFWFDAQGNYHQYFPSGGTFLHISDRPLVVRKANFTFK